MPRPASVFFFFIFSLSTQAHATAAIAKLYVSFYSLSSSYFIIFNMKVLVSVFGIFEIPLILISCHMIRLHCLYLSLQFARCQFELLLQLTFTFVNKSQCTFLRARKCSNPSTAVCRQLQKPFKSSFLVLMQFDFFVKYQTVRNFSFHTYYRRDLQETTGSCQKMHIPHLFYVFFLQFYPRLLGSLFFNT